MQLMKNAGLDIAFDTGGNIIGKRKGKNPSLKPVAFGSHIDMVPDGGDYDGTLGSISALEVIEVLNENKIVTNHPLEVIIFANEEGGLIGSKAMVGQLTADGLKQISQSILILGNKLKHHITVERNYSEESIVLIGNEGKLHQVFINLISNAEQAIQGNGIIRITTKKENGQLSIAIEDTGCGISKENLSKIGDPFFTTKLPGQGTGLGLSITYQIIESHGGKILVTSELNQGTKFLLLFDHIKSASS